MEELTLPNAQKLVEFCERNNYDFAFCRREYYKSIAEMFISKGTSKETYLKTKNNGLLNAKIRKFAIRDYFIIQGGELEGNIKRSAENFIENIFKYIDKIYL